MNICNGKKIKYFWEKTLQSNIIIISDPYVSPSVRRKTPGANLLLAQNHPRTPIHRSTYIPINDDTYQIFFMEMLYL